MVMPQQIRVRPGKTVSLAAMAVGLVFVLLGVAVVIPLFGFFGVAWTLLAGIIALYYAYNFFGGTGVSAYEVDVESQDFDAKLRKAAKLKEDGLISDEEYERKRAEIMGQRW
jgi:hypothetical protein